jgi:hypothetical protein
MKKIIASTLLSLSLSSAFAVSGADDAWVQVASEDNGTSYDILKGSVNITKNENDIFVVAGRSRIVAPDHSVMPQIWIVPLSHCDAGKGSLFIANLSGKLQGTSQFAFGTGTVGADIAEVLCTVAEKIIIENQNNTQKKFKGPTV